MNPPNWAQNLTRDTIGYLRASGYKCLMPVLRWRTKPYRKPSSGVCYPNHISITAGSSNIDAKVVLLHELAHWALSLNHDWVLPLYNIGHEGHTPEFWNLAWQLYKWAGLPEDYCLRRESNYRKGAELAYRRLH